MKKFLCVALLWAATGAVHARDLYWQALNSLGAGDRAHAEQTLYGEFGDNPEQWPDWIDPAALYAPTADGDRMLIVRRPAHEPCGQYRFAILGTVTPSRTRDNWGEFCGGDVEVIKVTGRNLPDLLVEQGSRQDENGIWQRKDQRLRWQDGKWWLVLKAEE